MKNDAPFLLVDADVLVYQAAAAAQKIISFEEDTFLPVASLTDALATFNLKLHALLRTLDATDYRLCFSDDDANLFRRKLFPAYKRNREGKPRPVILKPLRDHLLRELSPSRVCRKPALEADDCMGILATRPSFMPGRRKIIVSIDKDMRGIPGLFHDMGHPEQDVQTITTEQADLWFMTQTLTGDPVDGYPGCPGVGPATAAKLFRDAPPTIDALWPVVLAACAKAGLGPEYALTQARLARILRAEDYDFKKGTVKLWTPPSLPAGTPASPSSL
ncbi:MAG: hypothetical protein K2O70_06370 [Desulfovibrionaceae bacterium]|nr:hypothetical protein [Desulfovibrionaceae bacterium]